MKNKLIDATLISVLIGLIVLEFAVKSHELSHLQVIMGIIIGFSLGFKLSSIHGSTVSREAIKLARNKDIKLDESKNLIQQIQNSYEVELQRKDKLLKTLTVNLADRDNEIKELIKKK